MESLLLCLCMVALVPRGRDTPRWARVRVWVHTGVWRVGTSIHRCLGHGTQVPLGMGCASTLGCVTHLSFVRANIQVCDTPVPWSACSPSQARAIGLWVYLGVPGTHSAPAPTQGMHGCAALTASPVPGAWVPWLRGCPLQSPGCVRCGGVLALGHAAICCVGSRCRGAWWAQPVPGSHLSLSPLSRLQHSNAEFSSVAALLAHYSGPPGGCFCRLGPGRRNPGYEERDPGGGGASAGPGEAAWAPAAPAGAQHERG